MKSYWVLLLLIVDLIAFNSSEIIDLLGVDPENGLPEEDLVVLEEILTECRDVDRYCISKMTLLSFITADDIALLSGTPEQATASGLTPAIALLVELIEAFSDDFPVLVNLRQTCGFGRDTRYRWQVQAQPDRVRIGFQIERDPLEQEIADYRSGYITGSRNKIDWIIGDHQICSGFGLNLGRAMGVYKNFNSAAAQLRSGGGLRTYRSSGEGWGLRGLAIQFAGGPVRSSVSASNNCHDGTAESIPNLGSAGLHTTEGTIANADRLRENALCYAGEFKAGNYLIGLTGGVSRWYEKSLFLEQFSFISYYCKAGWNDVNIFGEVAYGLHNKKAFLGGINLKAVAFTYTISGRWFESGYQGFRANPLSEWAALEKNECGILQNLIYRTGHHRLMVYGDIYREQETEEAGCAPVAGIETGWRWEYSRAGYQVCLQVKSNERNIESIQYAGKADSLNREQRNTGKIVYTRSVTEKMKYKLQLNYCGLPSENWEAAGIGFVPTFNWKLKHLSVAVDWVVVRVPDYDHRLYFWDLNLPGEMRSRVYSGSGNYPGIRLEWKNGKDFNLSIRIRQIDSDATRCCESAVFLETNI